MYRGLSEHLEALLATGTPAVVVTVAATAGSTPREAGARMIVAENMIRGTIGGGVLEWEATATARALIASGDARERVALPLGPKTGQCCGGRVVLDLVRADQTVLAETRVLEDDERARLPAILVFGAGHVGAALVRALAPLPFDIRWIDERPDLFDDVPEDVRVCPESRPLTSVATAPPGAGFVVLTHSHALDFVLCEAILRRSDFRYLGLIGSRSKRRRFGRGWRALGLPEETIRRLVCPIGGDVRDKRPAVIAALVAAELLHAFDRAAPAVRPADEMRRIVAV